MASKTQMSSTDIPPNHTYPPVPPTLAGNYEMQDYYGGKHAPVPATDPDIHPYLGLRARLSQVWINRWTVLLLLILCRLLISTASLNDDIIDAKAEALSACTSVEKVGSAMASMPHYLSGGVNAMAADGVTKAINALMNMLLLTITGVGEIILFFINMLTSTYVCLITLVVAGSLTAALDLTKKVTALMEETIEDITGDMGTALSKFEDGFNGFLDKINVGGIFGGPSDPPEINLDSQISKLKSIDIDTSKFTADLDKIKENIPTFAEVQNVTNAAIRFPFQQVAKLINESMSAYTFDRSIFPLAQKKELSFCTDNPAINNFFDNLVNVVRKSRTIFMAVLIILAVAVCVPMAWREIRSYRIMKKHAQELSGHYDPMDVIYMASRPHSASAGVKMSHAFKNSSRKQIMVRWFVAYATSMPALFVLALGIAGLFSCLCQYIVLKVIEKEVPALAGQVGDFTETVVLALNGASTDWATSANGVVLSTNNQINDDVFGWVNTTTTAVNDTLNTFTDEMAKGLDVTFGGTILHDPIKELLNCLIGIKIAGVQKGLNWVSENARVDFPSFRPDVFSLGAAASLTNTTSDDSFLASPGSVASDDITGAVIKVSNKLQSMIREEAIISACVVGVWFIIVLIGLGRALFGMFGSDKTRGVGGSGLTGDNRSLSPRSPNRTDAARFPAFGGPVSSVHPEKSSEDLAYASGAHENVKSVGHRSVEASYQPGHERVSSHGRVSGYGDAKH